MVIIWSSIYGQCDPRKPKCSQIQYRLLPIVPFTIVTSIPFLILIRPISANPFRAIPPFCQLGLLVSPPCEVGSGVTLSRTHAALSRRARARLRCWQGAVFGRPVNFDSPQGVVLAKFLIKPNCVRPKLFRAGRCNLQRGPCLVSGLDNSIRIDV